jgi:hypothetical protein
MKPKPKGPSLERVAKVYRKAHSKPKVSHTGAHFADGMGGMTSRGSSDSNLTYKPKARGITLGGSRGGKGATIYKKGKA